MTDHIYTAIVADDEAPARERMQQILSDLKTVEIIAFATNGEEAVAKIDELQPDLLFLDIQMPGLNGFEVLKQISYLPIVIFCTAYDDYALKAFDTAAIDYLVKPIKKERVQQTIDKLRTLKLAPSKQDLMQLLEMYISKRQKKTATSIPVKLGERMLLIKLSEVSYFMSEEKYVYIVIKDGKKYLTDHSLKFLEEKLPAHFIRIHRAYLINSEIIREVNKHFGSRFIIRLDDSNTSKLVSGRNYYEKIKSLFEI